MPLPDPSTVRFDGPWTHQDVHANGIRFHTAEMGAGSDRPLVVFLHGFADFWWSWRHQLVGLADAGFHAVAVDLRGYGDSDKPPRGYDGWTLAGDVAGLIRALGHSDAMLVGHSTGGLVCWATAGLHPRVVRSIVAIGSPHPLVLKRAILRDREQRARLLPDLLRYQVPRYPERVLTRGDGFEVERLLRARVNQSWSRTDEFVDTARRMRAAVQIPGVAHSALEYHRWAFRSQWRPDGYRFLATVREPVDIPVLQIRGALDPYLTADTHSQLPGRLAPNHRLVTLPGAAHFAHQETPDAVTAELVTFEKR